MTPDVEGRLRAALHELTGTTPLANPEQPRGDAAPGGTAVGAACSEPEPPAPGGTGAPPAGSAPRRPVRANAKVLALAACVVLLIAAVVVVGTRHDAPRSLPPAAGAGTTAPATATDVAMPDVVGLSAIQAEQELKAAGLVYRMMVMEGASASPKVISQDPAADVEVPAGSKVEVTVIYSGSVPVPDVVGDSPTQAKLVLQQAGLQVVIGSETSTTAPDSLVVTAQTPAAGTVVTPGSTVTLDETLATPTGATPGG